MNNTNSFEFKSPIESIYLHIPFCKKKCHYCDFFSVTDLTQTDKYISYLNKEISLFFEQSGAPVNNIQTVFIGGGTPSLLPARHIESLINTLSKYLNFNSLSEFTLELNPGSVELEKLLAYRNIGINRLSIGIQSFNDDELKFLQRIHNAGQAVHAVELARAAGFDNLSFDLISCIPGQTLKSFENNLNYVKLLSPEHISVYNLIFEEGTPLFEDLKNSKVHEIDEDLQADFYLFCAEKLKEFGYNHYEVSNFAKIDNLTNRDFTCLHNQNYWKRENYFAFGAAANAFIGNQRYWNVSNLRAYYEMLDSDSLPIANSETLSIPNALNEYVMLGFRAGGININYLNQEFNINCSAAIDFINKLIHKGLAENISDLIKLTDSGYLISDKIILDFLECL